MAWSYESCSMLEACFPGSHRWHPFSIYGSLGSRGFFVLGPFSLTGVRGSPWSPKHNETIPNDLNSWRHAWTCKCFGGSDLLLGLPKLPGQLTNRASFLVVRHNRLDLGGTEDVLGKNWIFQGSSKLLTQWGLCAFKWHVACLSPATAHPAPHGRMPRACPGVLEVCRVKHETN